MRNFAWSGAASRIRCPVKEIQSTLCIIINIINAVVNANSLEIMYLRF